MKEGFWSKEGCIVVKYILESLVIVCILFLSMGGFPPIIYLSEVFDYLTTFLTSLYLSTSKDYGDLN